MKRTIIGVALLISATLADIGITLSASILAEGNTGSGKFWAAITTNGFLLPFMLVKLLFILDTGICYFNKRIFGEIKR